MTTHRQKLLKSTLTLLQNQPDGLPRRAVVQALEQSLDFDDDDNQILKSGLRRWVVNLHWVSVDAAKAGLITRTDGLWTLTSEGREIANLPEDQLYKKFRQAFARATQVPTDESQAAPADELDSQTGPADEVLEATAARELVFQDSQQQARQEIIRHISTLGPYEFQDLVAALLRGMGYYTRIVAQPGPDGGTDILAYPDPIGAKTPHIRVEVKHRPSSKASNAEIARLRGVIVPPREVGLFVSSSGFTSEAKRETNRGGTHIDLMDLNEFLDQWLIHYDRMAERDKSLLRLQPIYFLAPE